MIVPHGGTTWKTIDRRGGSIRTIASDPNFNNTSLVSNLFAPYLIKGNASNLWHLYQQCGTQPIADYDDWLEKLAPHEPISQYRHNRTGEDNGDAPQAADYELWSVIAVTNGKLDFGPWEQIHYAEFDGRRKKRALIKIIGE